MRTLFIHSILALSLAVSGQSLDLRFKHLTVQDGLSRSWVRCFLQDSQGLLWVGTNDGLNRYDGYAFRIYRYKGNSETGLNGNNISFLYEDSKGRFWAGTQDGLNLYNREKDYFVSLKGIKSSVESLCEMKNGLLLAGTTEGIYSVDPETLESRHIFNNIYASSMAKDPSGDIWLGTYNGLLLLNTDDYSYICYGKETGKSNSLSQNIIRSLLLDSRNRLWIGTNAGGLNLLTFREEDRSKPVFRHYLHHSDNKGSLNDGAILALLEDQSEHLWIGIENGGLNILDISEIEPADLKFEHYINHPSDEYSLSSNSVHSLFSDRDHTIWIGLYTSGIDYYHPLHNRFANYKHIAGYENNLSNNSINTIFEEGRFLYLGTEGGLNVVDRKSNLVRVFTHEASDPHSIGSNAVWAVKKDHTGTIWVGTWAGGLNVFNPEKQNFTRYINDPEDTLSLGSNSVYDIVEDKDGELWIATMGGGLNRYNREDRTFTRYQVDYNRNSISNNWVISLLTTKRGELWISTTTAVDLFNKEDGRFVNFQHDDKDPGSISYNRAIALFEDSRENIWIGTSAGLNLFIREDSSFRHFTTEEGLPDNTIKAIIEDDHGNLWLSTNRGIVKIVNGIFPGEQPEFVKYDYSDGLQGNEFNSRSTWKGADGMIYFGGTRGLNAFQPDSIKPDNFTPRVILTDFLIFNQPAAIDGENSPLQKQISQVEEIRLRHSQSVFTIEYAALNYLFPEKTSYAFKLEGFNNDWNYVGAQRSATYTNLDPGKYTFSVMGAINDRYHPENAVSLRIIVRPPWWGSPVARISYLLLIILALYFFRRYTLISVNLKNKLWLDSMQKQKDEELNKMKVQFFTNISHELRTPLTLIVGPLERLLRNRAGSRELKLINRNVHRLRNLVDQILDFQKIEDDALLIYPEETEMVSTIGSLVKSFGDLAEAKRIRLLFESDIQRLVMQADRDKIEKILTNLLSNAIKYTPESGEVRVSVCTNRNETGENGELQIKVSDTGKGIPEDEINRIFDRFYTTSGRRDNFVGTGIGLHLTRHLVELHKGTIRVESKPGRGSVFTVTIPVESEALLQSSPGKRKEEISQIQQPIPESPAEIKKSSGEYSIVVIDDNPDICDYLFTMLAEHYDVFIETQAREGLHRVLEQIPDLVISDIMMPEMNGFELCGHIKNDIRTSHIPVILLTARAAREDHIEGLEKGADDYIYKPFDDQILLSRIKNLIDQREKLREHFLGKDLVINPDPEVKDLDREFMRRVLDIIGEGYQDSEFNVNQLIDTLGMSRSVFYKKYKALSNHSINDLIREIRLKKAGELLTANSLSISEVAYKTGFSDPSYFTKVFREHYQLTPREYQHQRVE